jgi:hypothetical protein
MQANDVSRDAGRWFIRIGKQVHLSLLSNPEKNKDEGHSGFLSFFFFF